MLSKIITLDAHTRPSTFLGNPTSRPSGIHIPSSKSSPTLRLRKVIQDIPIANSSASQGLDPTSILSSRGSLPNIPIHKTRSLGSNCHQHPSTSGMCRSHSFYMDDEQFLVYCSPEDFLPCLLSKRPRPKDNDTTSALIPPLPDDDFFHLGAFVPPIPISVSLRRTLPGPFNFSTIADSISRLSGHLVASLAAKYRKEYPDDYENDISDEETFHWEGEMRCLEKNVRYFDA